MFKQLAIAIDLEATYQDMSRRYSAPGVGTFFHRESWFTSSACPRSLWEEAIAPLIGRAAARHPEM